VRLREICDKCSCVWGELERFDFVVCWSHRPSLKHSWADLKILSIISGGIRLE
jgi:hypothetical protein